LARRFDFAKGSNTMNSEAKKTVRVTIRQSTYEKIKTRSDPGLSFSDNLENMVNQTVERNQPEPLTDEIMALNKAVSGLTELVRNMDARIGQLLPGYTTESAPDAPELGLSRIDEQKQEAAQKDSPEFQAWLKKVFNGNGAVFSQKPVFETDQEGNVIYENGKPRVVNTMAVFDLVKDQLEKMNLPWTNENI
jgi:hypothetical protein